MLVSIPYLELYEEDFFLNKFVKSWILDSGAFTAYNAGEEIKFGNYIRVAKQVMSWKRKPEGIFALDVIGDYRASSQNAEKSWELGVPCIPVYHAGEPKKVLLDYAKNYPKIALGGVAKDKSRDKWCAACFDAVWPKPIHGLGVTDKKLLLSLPWHSVDSSSWNSQMRYGNWATYGELKGLKFTTKNWSINAGADVNYFLDLEELASHRWKKEIEKLDQMLVAA